MKEIQQLRRIAVKLGVSGTAIPLAETRLYKGGYGFVVLQAYAPYTQNRSPTTSPLCTVFRSTVDKFGNRKQFNKDIYNMLYVDDTEIENVKYMVFETPLPKEFTDTAGDLELVFIYSEVNTENKAATRLASGIYKTSVGDSDVFNGDTVDPTGGELARLNDITIKTELLEDSVNALLQPPDCTDANKVGTPNVSLTEGGRLKFSELKGEPGDGITTALTEIIEESERAKTAEDSLRNKIDTLSQNLTNQYADIEEIKHKIPSTASLTNQLADKSFVNSSINAMAAFYITYTQGDETHSGQAFHTHESLVNATTFYSGGQIRVPTQNDYALVLSDESQAQDLTGGYPTTRYSYQGGTYPDGQWDFQYIVNNTSLTQAQVDAINSGITEEFVQKINENSSTLNTKADIYYNDNAPTVKVDCQYNYENKTQVKTPDDISITDISTPITTSDSTIPVYFNPGTSNFCLNLSDVDGDKYKVSSAAEDFHLNTVGSYVELISAVNGMKISLNSGAPVETLYFKLCITYRTAKNPVYWFTLFNYVNGTIQVTTRTYTANEIIVSITNDVPHLSKVVYGKSY